MSHIKKRAIGLSAFVTSIALLAPAAMAQQSAIHACGELGNSFGPYDYQTERGQQLRLVEGAHFTLQVENLIRGNTSTVVGHDIDYTLRAFPNHHRALLATIRLAEKLKTTQPAGMSFSVDCWFDRAMRFRPDDLIVRMMYGNHLAKTKRVEEARRHLDYVASRAKDDPFTHYNLGLIYVDMQDYERALIQAHEAMALGFPRTELRDRLKAAGKWAEPTLPVAAASAPEAPAASAPRSP